ncbi:L-ascorbate metabolism protein UlaG (beta-lactamase superfamily) [Sphingomonas sp. SORGH_AS802]|uniref:MBL fold metallo-hydrolase n=1 Tax=unclassified Sphingomonas TaxID=196159 RepID=UPI0028553DD9|nr:MULTISPECIES: MBL fold metallo-hydrolase [unclassified Sphingomonas]MDR6126795.1 L-ascorbate metabolism protein UlaG (beta-lactamase superfamily) [Sphingomonas sp. SORGH_AS_0438]MDR6134842.1 L-ascorbate metabolism protein UlaG (beta-lactamase superfamily) [Sphingomonas sp. SORGH_AS_0802]
MVRNRYYDGPPSDHYDGTRFFNPGQASTDRGLRAMLRWKLAGGAAKWRASVPVTPARPAERVDGLCVTMVGHASLLIQAAGVNILTDPVWSERASPFRRVGPKRVTAPGIAFADLPPIDVVLLSHAHYDHLDLDTLRHLYTAHDPLMAMPLGNDAIVRAAVPAARCVTGDWWDRLDLGNGVASTLTPANHWSNRWPSDTRMTLWSGHYLDTPAGAIWFAGDTGYGDGRIFGEVRERLGAPDLALIPIGAYAPRWFMAAQHVDPAEAVRIFMDVGAGRALGIHWGTFQLTDEAREAPGEELTAALAAAHLAPDRFVAAEAGGVYRFG